MFPLALLIIATSNDLVDFTFPASSNELFPDNGIGSFVIEREILVKKIIDMVNGKKVSNYYFRGPRGSGKSFILNLLGKRLREMNKKVFLIRHAGELRTLSEERLKEVDDSCASERVYILIDEVHENPSDPLWDFLLKTEHAHLVVIGVGIPTLDGRSPAFTHKFPANFFLFKNEDLDNRVIGKFEELYKFGLASSGVDTRNVVEKTLSWVISYTGGHAFPFVKLSEYLLMCKKQDCIDDNWDSVVCCASFFDSDLSKAIIARSFQLSRDVKLASYKIFNLGIINESCEEDLENFGLWDSEKNWFISSLLIFHLFSCRKQTEYPSIDIQKVIEIGLSGLGEIHFSQMENGLPVARYENSISYYIGIRYFTIHRSLWWS